MLGNCPLTVSAYTESLPSANWLKDLTSAASPNHSLTLIWAGILLHPTSSCGYWAQHYLQRFINTPTVPFIICTVALVCVLPPNSVFSYLHENRLKLAAMLATVTLGKENLMGGNSVVGHSSVSLKHPDYYIWKTVLGLKERKYCCQLIKKFLINRTFLIINQVFFLYFWGWNE